MSAPPPSNAAMLLVIVGRRVQERLESELAEIGLTQRHLSALGHVAADGGLSYSELARRASVTVQSMKATMSRLEDIDAIAHGGDTGQGRRAELRVTPSGRRLLAKARTRVDRVERELLAGLDPDQRPALTAMLWQLAAATTGSNGVQRRGRGPHVTT